MAMCPEWLLGILHEFHDLVFADARLLEFVRDQAEAAGAFPVAKTKPPLVLQRYFLGH